MAVEVVYRSSRDPERLFMDKAEADRYDKMLELIGKRRQQSDDEIVEWITERADTAASGSWTSSWPKKEPPPMRTKTGLFKEKLQAPESSGRY